MKIKLKFLLCAFLFFSLYVSAQQAQIRGKVVEAETGDPLPGVSIAGSITGLKSYQRLGETGQDNAQFFIRGVTRFGTGEVNPLILIDETYKYFMILQNNN
ncbi:MAG: hypothetical protein VB068_07850 [Petrimonas sp.]|nr:hypothetical protein [Petrimonas sp.]MEA4978945.1 hypothetical protein [Petrimonas sp.]MEA5063206.1 hypothetical protein [Petrimonas sp.]